MAKRRAKVDYAPQPAEDPERPFRRIARPRVGSPIMGVIVSEEVVGVWVHWLNGHDAPHVEPASECTGCKVGNNTVRWKGYLECLTPLNGTCFLAELSEGAIRSCDKLATPGTPLRGRVLRLTRSGDSKNSRVVAEVGAIGAERNLPKPANVKLCLEAIWFGRQKELPFGDQEGEKDNEGTI